MNCVCISYYKGWLQHALSIPCVLSHADFRCIQAITLANLKAGWGLRQLWGAMVQIAGVQMKAVNLRRSDSPVSKGPESLPSGAQQGTDPPLPCSHHSRKRNAPTIQEAGKTLIKRCKEVGGLNHERWFMSSALVSVLVSLSPTDHWNIKV